MALIVPFQRRAVTLKLKTRIVGGIPTESRLIEGWLKKNMPEATEEERASLAATTLAEVPQRIEEESKAMWTTFKRTETDGALFIESRQIKAAFKEAANILREVLQKQEKKTERKECATGKDKSRFTALKAKLAERLFVEDDRLLLFDIDTKKPLLKPSGTEVRPIHVMTAQGERTALKKYDFCSNVFVTFNVRWLDDGVIDDDLFSALLEYMSWNGIGADRSQGEGLFTVECVTKL